MWFALSLLAGFSLAVRNLLSKLSAEKLPELVSMWFLFLFSLPVVVWALFFQPFVVVSNQFWILIGFRVLLEFSALFTFYKALKLEGISVVISLLALQPLLVIGTTFFINQQTSSALGLLATALVSVGIFLMYRSEAKQGESPEFIKATFLILLTVISYALLEPIHAKAISLSNVSSYLVASQLVVTLALSAIVFPFYYDQVVKTFQSKRNVLVNSSMGIALGTELIFLFSAFSLASNVAYVVSVASIHIMITSVGAFFILKETFTREKVMAIALVVISSILFALG